MNRIETFNDFDIYDPDRDNDYQRGDLKQRLSDALEGFAQQTQALGEILKEQVEAISRRRRTLAELEKLQANFNVPFKALEKRLSLLQQINMLDSAHDVRRMSTSELQARIDAVETINRLEPDPTNRPSIKSLRERVRLLSKIEFDEAEAVS
jgi:hypothetical protein